MDLHSLTSNKPLLYGGVAVVGGAGLFLVMKLRGGSAPSSSANTVAANGVDPGATVAGGFPDTSGSDIAGWLGQANAGLAQQLGDITTQLGDVQTALGNLQPTSGTGTGGTTPPIRTGLPTPIAARPIAMPPRLLRHPGAATT